MTLAAQIVWWLFLWLLVGFGVALLVGPLLRRRGGGQ